MHDLSVHQLPIDECNPPGAQRGIFFPKDAIHLGRDFVVHDSTIIFADDVDAEFLR
jgi:hypothetical protein